MLCTDCHKREVEISRSSCKCFICLEKRRKYQNKYNQGHKKECVQKAQKYYQEHKQQVLDYHCKYYQDKIEIIREKQKDRYINPEKHAKVLQAAKDYMNTHKEKVAEIKRRCARAKPEHYLAKGREGVHRRRARITGNGGSFTPKEWQELKKMYNYHCLCCGEQKPLQMDHVVPIVLGGTNYINNIQPLCRECNNKKRISIIDYRWDVT